jgi:hypothetical protein
VERFKLEPELASKGVFLVIDEPYAGELWSEIELGM